MTEPTRLTVSSDLAEKTLAAVIRTLLPGQSWNHVRRLIETRHAKINGELCLDPARRVHSGEVIDLLASSAPRPKLPEEVRIRHLDTHFLVVEKPSGLSTVRHPTERSWDSQRKALSPTLEDIVPKLIARQERSVAKGPLPRLRIVHRLDKETSGLLVFARTVIAESALGKQFQRHTVTRRYLTVVPGEVRTRTIRSLLVRDRGDGRRGSNPHGNDGKEAITHVTIEETLPGYTLLSCRLETGRTHQIRIHLAEIGHPVCGEKVYNRPFGEEAIVDTSGAPRLALHATELGFEHPVTGASLHWTMPLPGDLEAFVKRLRGGHAQD
jgi:23S rRNA pseudouridine1911/1915/1917 synthase